MKERERADAEEEARHMEQLEEVKRRSEAEAKEAEEARRVAEQAAAQQVLPDEPAEDSPDPQANIRLISRILEYARLDTRARKLKGL